MPGEPSVFTLIDPDGCELEVTFHLDSVEVFVSDGVQHGLPVVYLNREQARSLAGYLIDFTQKQGGAYI